MTEKDDPEGDKQAKEPEPKRTYDVPVPQVGETTVPAGKDVPCVEPRKIHPRRRLPIVPKKPEDPKVEPGDSPNS